ncbi:MAG: NAD-glutamate dehydrogenase, partial [Gammaproteobacteria bacterium]|nr:NAD-glutamate dehydrogenase [Gammaproteobacteria bacterium]
MNNKWCQQLTKQVNENPAIQKLKVSDDTFSVNYQEDFAVADALYDLEVLALISNDNRVQARLVTISREGKKYSIKLYTLKDSIPLSQSMPIFESMNLQVLIGRPYKIRLAGKLYWIHHFTLDGGESICDIHPEKIPRYFSGMFESIWNQRSENDGFNHLLFSACIKARNIQIIRAYVTYLNQIRFPHSRTYIIETLNAYPDITLLLVICFLHKFDPLKTDRESLQKIIDTINEKITNIESLDHDLIFRRM